MYIQHLASLPHYYGQSALSVLIGVSIFSTTDIFRFSESRSDLVPSSFSLATVRQVLQKRLAGRLRATQTKEVGMQAA
jgi:hypothetical protein